MRTFSALTAIVALSTLSVYAAPVQLDGNVHPTVGNVRAVVDVIHTKVNGVVPRDVDDSVHNVPTVDAISGKVNNIAPRLDEIDPVKIPAVDTTTPGNLNRIVPRVNGNGATHRTGTGSGSVKGVIPRAGGDDTLDHVPTVNAISGNVNNVVPRDGEEPPCDGEDGVSGNGENTQ